MKGTGRGLFGSYPRDPADSRTAETRLEFRGIHRAMRFPLRRTATLAALALLASGCAARRNRTPAPRGPDPTFQSGMSAFQARKWDRAIQNMERFVRDYLGDPRVPQALLTTGRAYIGKREYLAAVTPLQRLVAAFNTDSLANEAQALTCEAYTRLAPRAALDQEYTLAAIGHCEAAIQRAPGTELARQAEERRVDLRSRLARKLYDTGDFYARRRLHDSALLYFQRAVDQYADTPVAPQALLRLEETYTRIGYREEAEAARARLLRDYPTSPEAQRRPPGNRSG